MKDPELAVKLTEMRAKAFALLVSMSKDYSLEDKHFRQIIREQNSKIMVFMSDNLEDE